MLLIIVMGGMDNAMMVAVGGEDSNGSALGYPFMDTQGFGRPSRRDGTQHAAESHETSWVLPKTII